MKRYLLILLVMISSAAIAQNYNSLSGPTGGGADKMILAGSGRLLAFKNGAGVYRSDDAGATWVKSDTGLNSPWVLDIFMDNSGKVYVLYGESLFVSNDNGTGWTLKANTGFTSAQRLAQGPSGNLFIASNSKVYRSTDGGSSWFERITFTTGYLTINDFEFTAGGKMMISTYGAGMFTTAAETDLSATSLTTANSGVPSDVLFNIVQNGSNIYVLTAAGPAKSTNQATSFSSMLTITPTGGSLPTANGYYNDILEKDLSGNLYVTYDNTLYKSTDGNAWSSTTITGPAPGATPQYKGLLFTSATTAYLNLYGVGFYKTTTSGTSWASANTGYYGNDLKNIEITDNGRLLVSKGAGHGLYLSADDGVNWDFVGSGNVTKNFSTFKKVGSTIFAFGQGIIKTTDNAASWTVVHNGLSTNFLSYFGYPLTNDGTTIYNFDTYDSQTGQQTFGMWKSTNGGGTFTRTLIAGLPGTNLATFLSDHSAAIDASGNIYLIIYTYSTGTTALYKIPNGSATATQITNTGLTFIYDVTSKNGKVYAAANQKVAVTSDAGATWTTKTISGGFSEIKVIDDNTIFAYANTIFLSTDGGVNWTNTGTTANGAAVNDIAVSPGNYSYPITANAGAFKSKKTIIPPLAPSALTILASGHDAVALEWTDNSSTETYFRIEASKTNASNYDSVGYAEREEYFPRQQAFSYIYKLLPGTKYFFRVKAVGPGGYSAASNEVSVTLQTDCTASSDIPTNRSWTVTSMNLSGTNVPPTLNQSVRQYTGAPGNLFLENVTIGLSPELDDPLGANIINNCGQVFLNFDDSGGQEWIPNGQATWDPITKKITVPMKTHPQFSPVTETIVYTLNSTDPAPETPQNLIGGVYTTGSVLIGWERVNFVSKYEIERSTAVNTAYTKIGEVPLGGVSYKDLDPALVAGTKYYYRIRAVNSTGNSGYSNEINVTPSNQYNFDSFNTLPSKMFFTSSTGGAWGDIDGDGIDDLIIGSSEDSLGNALPPIAFKGYADGKFTKLNIDELSLGNNGDYRMISIVDVNNDGLNDLFFSQTASHDYLLLQNSDHTFSKTDMPYNPSNNIGGHNWVDIDNDGDLDLVYNGDISISADVKIYKNNGSGVLTPYTDSEITTAINGGTRDMEFADFDNDGLVDVLKINRQTPSTQHTTLYRNTGDGNFKLMIGSVFENYRAGNRTASWGDYDNDGDLDVFLGCQTKTTLDFSNRLFKNNGDGTFSEVAGSAMTEQVLTYGSAWADIDNDTDLDLLISTGESNVIYFNNGNGTFSKSTKSELFTNPNMGKLYGLAMADVNNDGFLDFYVGGFSGENIPNFIFKNQTAATAGRNWLKVKLQGTQSNRSAIGVRLKMVVGGKTLTRYVQSHSSFGTQSSLIQHFGLGSSTSITSLTIYWPSGIIQTMTPISTVNTTITVVEDNTGPVITDLSPANDSDVSDVTKLEITFDEDISPIAGKKLHLVNITDATASVDIDASSATKTTNKLSFTVSKLLQDKDFEISIDAGAFKDVYGNLSAAITPAQWSFHTVEPPDATPPTITFTPEDLDILEKGFAPLSVPVIIQDEKELASAKFFHRKVGAAGNFEEVNLGVVNVSSIQVTSAMVDDMGMEFYFEAEDKNHNKTTKPADGTYYRAVIQYTGSSRPTISVPGAGTAESWKIISVPYDLPTTQVSQIFSDLGAPSKSTWRLIRYTLNGSAQAWSEYPNGFNAIERGKGYFINSTTSKDVIISDPKSPSYSQENLFKMDLVQGWNQIGNPYSININWNDVRTYNAKTAIVKELYLFSAGSYGQNPELLKETGGFVFATEAVDDLSISFPGMAAPARIQQKSFGPIDSENWMVNFSASNGEAKSPIGGIGMTPESSNSYDEFDQFSPPRFINYVEFNFSHPEYFYPRFGRDMVTTSEEHVWEFELETNQSGFTTLTWDKPSVGDSDVQLYLYDVTRQKPVDMIAETSYTLDPSQGSKFKVYYGRDVLGKIKPNRTLLGAAYPNPTSSATTISFSIPERNGRVNVRLEVFDLTGRKVSTIASGSFEAGFYSAEWHPHESAPNGMYVYRLFAGDEVLADKLILKK